ncbi:bifunctional 3,4-dihydroxy-2-butanone-4-phosphate synthase/GTP cyclohydrolase II [Chitinimonas sp. BJB300]|uniref:bifunctional 3,4-dihydroxy-2-butanone-4-phosphate synthase/GTP cyclohydrolase II n=1 Tax=Chitinimonas sp. BJB300 TaxID=1559339 RepID=UPI000C0D7F98|nr:bifunctional 3,4-dihydroxy-2-butanone-4-phosphate synthase/GTP cyclohydrolase II [Chitinimonas sp. BJB300]PHV13194.1 3,4-dihydroxy-2-butanone-4-phosphate synthase [Chitinimonas sp. BJB300]TSJ87178.1 3,4-dihydroxy-2-butanone-4-phosphate synthase [Chitinimonas sp. BJB300]
MQISSIPDLIAELAAGRMIVLMDDEDRENEGDLVMAAEHATPEAINFMAKHARGLICLTLTEQRCRQLNLPLMVSRNGASHGTNFTLSIEAATGVSTGISAADRARTVLAAVAPQAKPTDIVQPGHIFPLMAREGGVLARAGHTEAGCDLANMAGCLPASVICEVMNDDGTMARLPELLPFAEQHNLKIGTIADLIQYRSRTESLVERMGERAITTPAGVFQMVIFREQGNAATHLALVKGSFGPQDEVLVRVHEPLSVMDWMDAGQTRHSWGIYQSLAAINEAGRGVVVLLHRNEGGEELLAKALPELNLNTPQKWDLRTYGVGAQMLKSLGVGKMKLLSPTRKMPSMAGFGLEVAGFIEG